MCMFTYLCMSVFVWVFLIFLRVCVCKSVHVYVNEQALYGLDQHYPTIFSAKCPKIRINFYFASKSFYFWKGPFWGTDF